MRSYFLHSFPTMPMNASTYKSLAATFALYGVYYFCYVEQTAVGHTVLR
jgi:hypothetical protein